MANEQNLIPNDARTPKQRRENASKAGIASGKARRQKKQMHELVSLMLDSKTTPKQAAQLMKQFPDLEGEDITIASAMVAGQIQSAMKGNTKAFNALRELNDKGNKKDDNKAYTIPITDITVDFVEVYRAVHKAFSDGSLREVISKGGRGSIKSNFWSALAEETIYNDPQAHVVFTRRYKTDLRGSVYNQFLKTVTRHNNLDEWDFTTSPMEATYKKTGQKVIFVGCDKPISLKSYNLPFGYVKLLIHEECDEMAGVEQMDNVEDTFLRNDTPSIDIKIFNPPKSVDNFMNQYVIDCQNKTGTLICHSYYYNVPVEWLGQRFFDRAEWFKENKPMYYANNYLGEVTGTGGLVFDNIEEREITDAEIDAMEHFNHGLDFGFAIDPLAYGKMFYNKKEHSLYFIDEIYEVKMSNEVAIERIEKIAGKDYINADSAEPRTINEFNQKGLNVLPVKKGKDSVNRGMKWLQDLNKIVIDKKRTPNAYKEFTTYEYETDREGKYISKYPDKNNHYIDCTRYAMEKEINSKELRWG